MNINLNWSAPEYAIWFGSGFAAYYLRYGNQWQGNEIRLAYNVFFGILNLIGWCIEWVWFNTNWSAIIAVISAVVAVGCFLWICHLPPFRRRFF